MKIIFSILILSFSAHASEAPAVVKEVQSAFRNIQTLETNFTQTVSSIRFGEKKSSGKLTIQRPGKMIWNYSDPKGKVFAANGEIITLYDPEEKQALVSPQPKDGKLPAGLSFLMGQSNLTDFFNVEIVSDGKNASGQREVKLFCKPKSEMEFKELELTFVWKPQVTLVSSTTKDMLDSKNQIQFDRMKINPSISAKAFDVKLPKGTPVVTSNSL
ncbi:MAG: outer membrane lipoprotein carrier protein LolA [Bdellovibrionota bacterium]